MLIDDTSRIPQEAIFWIKSNMAWLREDWSNNLDGKGFWNFAYRRYQEYGA
ncbi:hypothetical protein J0J26_20670 [Vibrio vulnificus]|uniref:hypothetical protein n=1 Tax=Vibrio vulnificus TaxID=672 RepID=UPI0019D449B5|nr:hypothetical protein [Vibrio vulnificus]MBN8090467.1 hypothetical protein [Vibrio vulnificus]MBN8119348.1 hypothetical protein [Vibrio vulnificus]